MKDVFGANCMVPDGPVRRSRGTLTVSLPAELVARLRVVAAADGDSLSRAVERALAPFVLARIDAAVARLATGENV